MRDSLRQSKTEAGYRCGFRAEEFGAIPRSSRGRVCLSRAGVVEIRGVTEKYLLREAAKPLITETVYRRQKHPFLSPPVTTVPTERFHQMMQDILRGPILTSLPFYDRNKIVALLDQLPAMSDSDRVGWDPTLMSVLSERFGLGSELAGNDAFAVGWHPVMGFRGSGPACLGGGVARKNATTQALTREICQRREEVRLVPKVSLNAAILDISLLKDLQK